MDKDLQIKFSFFDALQKKYASSFGDREWDGYALNYYHFKKKPFGVIFSWNWRTREGESLVAEILIYNKNGGDDLYKYLKENSSSPNPFEWFVMPGASRIIYEIDPDVNVGALLTNETYTEELIYMALGAMHLLEEEYLHLIENYFEEYIVETTSSERREYKMEDPHVQAIKDIIRTLPKDKIMSIREAIDISFHLLPMSPGIQFSSKVKEDIKEVIQLLKHRYIEDVITVQAVLPISIHSMEQQTGMSLGEEGNMLIEMFTDELKKFPGGYGVKGPGEIGSLVHLLIESNESKKIELCNSHPDALLLDTDFGLANFGMMAMINKNSEVESRVYQTRNRMAVIRKNRK